MQTGGGWNQLPSISVSQTGCQSGESGDASAKWRCSSGRGNQQDQAGWLRAVNGGNCESGSQILPASGKHLARALAFDCSSSQDSWVALSKENAMTCVTARKNLRIGPALFSGSLMESSAQDAQAALRPAALRQPCAQLAFRHRAGPKSQLRSSSRKPDWPRKVEAC